MQLATISCLEIIAAQLKVCWEAYDATIGCTWALLDNVKSTVSSDKPELFVLHISHIIVVGIFESLCNPGVVPFLVFSCTDESVNECEDYTNSRRYNLHYRQSLDD